MKLACLTRRLRLGQEFPQQAVTPEYLPHAKPVLHRQALPFLRGRLLPYPVHSPPQSAFDNGTKHFHLILHLLQSVLLFRGSKFPESDFQKTERQGIPLRQFLQGINRRHQPDNGIDVPIELLLGISHGINPQPIRHEHPRIHHKIIPCPLPIDHITDFELHDKPVFAAYLNINHRLSCFSYMQR